jgi:hypothetical protein
MYWIVKNGEIIEFIKTLPTSTANISWLDKLPEDKLRELGYYKVIWASEPLQEWQSYWQASYEIWEEYITETKEIINQSLEDFKTKKIWEQSQRTNQVILDEYSYEDQLNINRELWTLQDKYNATWEVNIERVMELRWMNEWIETQRAEYQTLKQSILWATTYEEVISLIPILETNEI